MRAPAPLRGRTNELQTVADGAPPDPLTRANTELDDGLWRQLLADNLALTRVMAVVVGVTQIVFLAIDPWVAAQAGSAAAYAALPWLTAARVVAIVLCVALLVVRRSSRPRTTTDRVALAWVAAWLGAMLGCMAVVIGLAGWSQPTPGFFVAAVLFLGLTVTVKVPSRWAAAVFATGLAGALVPVLTAPGPSGADLVSEVVNMSLMTLAGFGTSHIAFRRRRQAYVDAHTIARQHAELAAANERLRGALAVAEENRVKALAAANAKSAFLARMSHEIRTPLHGVIGMTELMLAEETRPAERGHLVVVYDSASALLKIVNDVLDFSRMEAAPLPPAVTRFDVTVLMRSVVAVFEPVAAKRGATLTYGDAGTAVWCLADPGRVRQVLANLVDNALKFSSGGRVTVRCVAADGARELVLEVADTGIGIREDRLQAIVEPFEQADASVAGRFGGTGLGLAISAQLVTMMGGRITVQSEVGRGSTFRVSLPVPAELPIPAVAAPPEPAAPAGCAPFSVLVADDTAVNAMLARRILQRAGHRVREVNSGADVLAALAVETFDVVFMEIGRASCRERV